MSTTDAKSASAPWRNAEEVGKVVSPPKKSSAPPAALWEDWKTTTVPKTGAADVQFQFGRQGDDQDGYREAVLPTPNEQAISKAADRLVGQPVPPPMWTGGKKEVNPTTEKVAKAGATAKAQGIDPPDVLPAKTLPWTSKAGSRGVVDGWEKATEMATVSKQKAPPLPTPRGMRPAGAPAANSSPLAEKEQVPEVASLPKAPRPTLPRPLGKGQTGSAAKVAALDEPTSKALPGGKGQARLPAFN